MSHPCRPDSRPLYHADYTESMTSDTLLKIRNDLLKSPESAKAWTWEAKRLKRINQVLGSRDINLKAKKMRQTEKQIPENKIPKPRAHNHIPASHREKPILTQGISKDELAKAKAQAARFLSNARAEARQPGANSDTQ
jgi:hypothetical protein